MADYTITVLPDSIDTSEIPSTGLNPSDKVDFQVGGGRTDSPGVTITTAGTSTKKTPFSPSDNPISVPSTGTTRQYNVNNGSGGDYELSAPSSGTKKGTATGTIKVNN
jgi:hypothetical protein